MAISRGMHRIRGVRSERLRNIIDVLNRAKMFKMNEPAFLDLSIILRKQDNPVADVNRMPENRGILSLAYGFDRSFPLETVELLSFNLKHDKNVESATIHIGQSADEFARSMNLLALVIEDDIYFRGNKFNTTTEEGRKLLAHELTHVGQSKNQEYKGKEELELEAEHAERVEVIESDPLETIELSGRSYRIRRSERKKIIYMVADSIINWVEEQKIMSNEKDYLKLLLALKDYVTGFETIWHPKTQENRQMEQDFKSELRWRLRI